MKSAENKTGLEHPRGTEQHRMVSAQCGTVLDARRSRDALWNGNEQERTGQLDGSVERLFSDAANNVVGKRLQHLIDACEHRNTTWSLINQLLLRPKGDSTAD